MLHSSKTDIFSHSVMVNVTFQSDVSLRYENGSAYFHEDDREGLVKVCRLVIHARYEEYASDGYAALSSKQPVIYQSASGRPGLGQHLCSQVRRVKHKVSQHINDGE